jgi:hypothetical protein
MRFPYRAAAARGLFPCLSLALALGMSACALFRAGQGVKSCRYHYRDFHFASVDQAKTYWLIDVDVVNPNAKPVTLDRMRFSLLHADDTLVTAWNPKRKQLAPGDSLSFRSSLEIPHALLQRLPPGLLADPRAEFTLVGDAYLDTWLGEMTLPGALRQTLHVNMPEQVNKVRDLFLRRMFPGFGKPKSPGQEEL